MKVYISGKIGEEVISDATRQKFARAEEMLKAKGYEVLNPCTKEWQDDLKSYYTQILSYYIFSKRIPDFYNFALIYDEIRISNCDAVYFLEDWDKSPGANAEYSFAMAIGKKLLWQRLEDAQVFHDDDEKPEDVWLPIDM